MISLSSSSSTFTAKQCRLPQEPILLERWLDPMFNEIEQFEPFLQPHTPQNLIAHLIDKPMTYKDISEPQLIHQDYR